MSETPSIYNKPSRKVTDPELLASVTDDHSSRPASVQTLELHIDSIVPDPDQPRKHIPDGVIDERRKQMEAEGQLSPITVFPGELIDGKMVYKLFDGECRWRAALLSDSLNFLRAEITAVAPDDAFTILSQQLLHNDDGAEPLNNLERAAAYLKLVEQAKAAGSDNPFGEVATVLGKHSSEVSRIISLVDLPDFVIKFSLDMGIDDPKILSGFKQVLKHSDDKQARLLQSTIKDAVQNKLNVRKVVADFVGNVKAKNGSVKKKTKAVKLQPKKVRQLNVNDLSFVNGVLVIDTPREVIKLKFADEVFEKLKSLC